MSEHTLLRNCLPCRNLYALRTSQKTFLSNDLYATIKAGRYSSTANIEKMLTNMLASSVSSRVTECFKVLEKYSDSLVSEFENSMG